MKKKPAKTDLQNLLDKALAKALEEYGKSIQPLDGALNYVRAEAVERFSGIVETVFTEMLAESETDENQL